LATAAAVAHLNLLRLRGYARHPVQLILDPRMWK
jgi:hypothetical protein